MDINEKYDKVPYINIIIFVLGKPAGETDVNNPDWLPCRNLGYGVGSALKRSADFDRYDRSVKRVKYNQCHYELSFTILVIQRFR